MGAARDLLGELKSVDRSDYGHLFDASTEDDKGSKGSVRVTFLGVSTLLVEDGETTLMTDGFFSRPGLLRLRFGRLKPNRARVAEALARIGLSRLDALFVAHSHFDHALDSAVVAQSTGATLYGVSVDAVHRRDPGLRPGAVPATRDRHANAVRAVHRHRGPGPAQPWRPYSRSHRGAGPHGPTNDGPQDR